jgi:DNA-binding transcriptional ArsR family regulator
LTVERRPATAEEAKALAHPLRLRILRLCLDEALTNKQLAEQLDKDPGTVLHHVRTLVETGFLRAVEVRTGAKGALEKPYQATGKSWTLDVGDAAGSLALVDAFREEVLEAGPKAIIAQSRFAMRLSAESRRDLVERLEALADEFALRDDPGGQPVALYFGVHRRRQPARRKTPNGRTGSTG